MNRARIAVSALIACLSAPGGFAAGAKAALFAGMTCVEASSDLLEEVEQAYGEACGVFVKEVSAGSLSAKAGVEAGDILLSVRLPEESEFYCIPAAIDDMIQFAAQTPPSGEMRLLVLRGTQGRFEKIVYRLAARAASDAAKAAARDGGDKTGTAAPAPPCEASDGETHAPGQPPLPGGLSFEKGDRSAILATAPGGAPLRQSDVDLYGGLLAWAFGTRLTEAQKGAVAKSLSEFWKEATPQFLEDFDKGIRSMPGLIPKLQAQAREQLRVGFANVFFNLASSMPGHPLAAVIMTVSGNARQVLAGAGTAAELTQQDVDALLEYLCFQTRVQTGQLPVITADQHAAFTRQTIASFATATDEQKQTLAGMDTMWARFRTAWTLAQAAQQQAVAAQWRQSLSAGAANGGYAPNIAGWQSSAGSGGQMSDSQYEAVMNSMRDTHYASMHALGGIDGSYDGSWYDSSGNWLYDE